MSSTRATSPASRQSFVYSPALSQSAAFARGQVPSSDIGYGCCTVTCGTSLCDITVDDPTGGRDGSSRRSLQHWMEQL